MTWIKCSERLPENNIEVALIYEHPFWGSCLAKGAYNGESYHIVYNSGTRTVHTNRIKKSDIVAWMPLPDAPEE